MKKSNKIVIKTREAKPALLKRPTKSNLEKKIRQQSNQLRIKKGQLKLGAVTGKSLRKHWKDLRVTWKGRFI
jgi:hypothetical protein